jgi:cysteine desulfurase/selenocysteine lyase
VGFVSAIDYLNQIGMENVHVAETKLTAYLLSKLSTTKDIAILGSTDPKKRNGLVSFTIKGVHPHDVSAMLAESNICVRSGHHCAMPIHERLGVAASTRASVYVYNTKEDIDVLADKLEKIKKIFK